jgi:Uma2 family endonuclease
MVQTAGWTSADLERLPQKEGVRYEIIAGELIVTTQPHYYHQDICSNIVTLLGSWSYQTGLGTAPIAPGVIFADDDDVAPDVVWVSNKRLREILGADGHLHGPPELVVEVLSPGSTNERCDRQAKMDLHSRRGVDEYWIVDWRQHTVDVYRRIGGILEPVGMFSGDAAIESPLLPGFVAPLERVFAGIP